MRYVRDAPFTTYILCACLSCVGANQRQIRAKRLSFLPTHLTLDTSRSERREDMWNRDVKSEERGGRREGGGYVGSEQRVTPSFVQNENGHMRELQKIDSKDADSK